ncbi:probable G-protein coupled receptor 132 [Hemicordylus capensis]|uniref:probable G-protein coupled receptor 132 n=1 Tax=Hemicordylus capensis TaxID=884348 RepID=UPI0023036C1D|nr:probable G-protein coupled receptor 132 [Hemicordylus capensis]XP_053139486.1 probable G-protein coupled receptor 132 [Hemicordylus capensis]XP_053139487.1 probable G-protein coupled receptor 132 [Hemicordylus capensis]XP_053139488.1 probable G-protein coupled receptor 132 [Hemicordylus capensis]
MTPGNNSTHCNPKDMPFEDSRQLLVVVYSIVFAVGIPTNCLTAALTLIQIGRDNIPAIYLFALSVCELLYVSTIPLWIKYVQNGHVWTMGLLPCKVTGYIFFCNIYISILLLCCISIDRYVAVVYALESRGMRSQRIAVVVTIVLFGVIAVIHSPVFFTDIQDKNITTCFETPYTRRVAIYSVVRFFVGFFVPFLILIFMNYKIFQSIKTSCSLTPPQKTKVKLLTISIIAIFVICFAPYHFVLLIRSVHTLLHPGASCSFERSIYTVNVVFLCLSTANSMADPFIYVLASENARREISRAFRALRMQWPNSSQTDSGKVKNSPRSLEENRTLGNTGDR